MSHLRHSNGLSCRVVLAAAALLSVVLLPAPAEAHVPFLESAQRSDSQGTRDVPYPGAQTLPSPTISRAIYGYLAPGAKFDAYTFTVPNEVTAEVALIVPKRRGLQDFRPSLVIHEEGSNKILKVPDPGTRPRTSFYEPFSIASFYNGPVTTFTFRPGERYYVVVNPPKTDPGGGAYVLTFGGAEQFSAGDWASSISVMPTIWIGSWAGGPVRPGINVCGVVLVVLVVVVIWLTIRSRRRRAAETNESPESTSSQAP